MKVLHVIPYASSVYGGPVDAVAQMAKALSDLDVEVAVVTTTAHGNYELDVPTHRSIIRDGARYSYFTRSGPRFWMFSWSLRCWLYRHVCEYDLVHVHGLFAYTTLPACASARHFGKPYVITPHGMLDPWCFSHKSWKKLPYYWLLERRNLHNAAAIHVTSTFESIGVAKLGFGAKINIIPLSVKAPLSRVRHYDQGIPLMLLFMSRIVPIKGLPTLLQALALFRSRSSVPIVLKIAGQGSDEYLAELQAQVESLKLSANVEFVGFVQGEMKSRIFAEADVFVLPSYHENFSLSTAEAMGAGLPVIVSDQVGIAGEIRQASAGIVVPTDSPTALAEAIEKFSDIEFRRRAGESGRRLVEKRFSKEQLGDSLLQLYVKVIANPKHSGIQDLT